MAYKSSIKIKNRNSADKPLDTRILYAFTTLVISFQSVTTYKKGMDNFKLSVKVNA